MLDPVLKSSLLLTAEALGGFEKDPITLESTYIKGDECAECIGDLVRAIKRDEEESAVLWQLAEWRILQKDLVNIVTGYSHDEILFRVTLRLLVYLTNPIEFNSSDTAGHLRCLQEHKEALIDRDVFAVIAGALGLALVKPTDERTDSDTEIIINTLHLLRNLAFIPDQLTTATPYGRQTFRLQSILVERFHEGHIFDLLLTLCGTFEDRDSLDGERVGHSVLEIFYLLFLHTTPESLVACRDLEAKNQSRLASVVADDAAATQRALMTGSSSARHVRFGGSFAVRTADGDALPFVRDLGQLRDYTHDTGKKARTRAVPHKKRVQAISFRDSELDDASDALLRSLALDFLDSGYNALVQYFLKEISSGRNTYTRDHMHLLWLTHFMLRFVALHHKDTVAVRKAAGLPEEDDEAPNVFEMVGASLDINAIQFVLRRMELYREEKDAANAYVALKALGETLFALDVMSSSGGRLRAVADSIQRRLYYEPALESELLHALAGYAGQSRRFLEDIVLAVHTHLRLLERYSKEKPTIMVQVKRKVPRPRQPKQGEESTNQKPANPESTNQDEGEEEEYDTIVEERQEEVDRHVMIDRRMTFESCVQRFGNEKCLRHYVALLDGYDRNERDLNHAIIKFFYRLYLLEDRRPLFFKVSTLSVFSHVLQMLRPEKDADDADAQKIITAILRAFFKRWETLPSLYFEALFPKTEANCKYVFSGETSDTTAMYNKAALEDAATQDGSRDETVSYDYNDGEMGAGHVDEFDGDAPVRPRASSSASSVMTTSVTSSGKKARKEKRPEKKRNSAPAGADDDNNSVSVPKRSRKKAGPKPPPANETETQRLKRLRREATKRARAELAARQGQFDENALAPVFSAAVAGAAAREERRAEESSSSSSEDEEGGEQSVRSASLALLRRMRNAASVAEPEERQPERSSPKRKVPDSEEEEEGEKAEAEEESGRYSSPASPRNESESRSASASPAPRAAPARRRMVTVSDDEDE